MSYDRFSYITPPRAEAVIPRVMLKDFEKRGWWAQTKKNGTNSVIFVGPDRKPFAYNRHAEPHKQWKFTNESAALFTVLPGEKWYVFNAELLHSKVKGGLKDTNYVHDILVADGTYLLGTTYAERYDILENTMIDVANILNLDMRLSKGYYQLTPKTLLAQVYKPGENYIELFDSLQGAENEGLVLKEPHSPLRTTDGRNARWLAKCRKANKNLGF